MIVNRYPYTDAHELNLDWILKKIKELGIKVDEFTALNEITFDGAWDISEAYPAWHIVTFENYAYLALKPVPAGVDISNSDYWQVIFSLVAASPFLPSNRNVIALADSYGMVTSPGFFQMIKDNQGIENMLIDAVSGRSFARATNTFLQAIQTIDGNINYQDQVTDIVVCGGYNDGQHIQYDGGTAADVRNAIANFIAYCKTHFKNAKVYIGFIAWTKATAGISKGTMLTTLNAYKAGAKLGGLYLNNVEYILRNIRLLDNDNPGGYHPNYDGAVALAEYVFQSWFTGSCDVRYTENIGSNYELDAGINNPTIYNFSFYASIHNDLGRLFGAELSMRIGNTSSPYLLSIADDGWAAIFKDTNPTFKNDYAHGICDALIRYGTPYVDESMKLEFRFLGDTFYIRAPKALSNIQILYLRGINITFDMDY